MYLASLLQYCTDFKASSTTPPRRIVFMRSCNRSFNDVVCAVHFYYEGITLFTIMNVRPRFFAAHVGMMTNNEKGIYTFWFVWISQFWLPASVQHNDSFQIIENKPLIICCVDTFRWASPHRDASNVIGSRPSVIRSVFHSFCHPNPVLNVPFFAVWAIRIWIHIY